MAVKINNILSGKFTGGVDLDTVVNTDDTADVMVYKSYVMGDDKNCHGLIQSIKDII